MVTSLPSLSLSVSLSLSLSLSPSLPLYLSLSHTRKYLTHNIGSAEALPMYCAWGALGERERERERERDGIRSDVTLVALKLAMSFALFLAKNLHLSIGEEFWTIPCQKFAPLPPLLDGAEFTLTVAKNVSLFETVPDLRFASIKWRQRGSKHRNKRSNFRLHRPFSHRKNESN